MVSQEEEKQDDKLRVLILWNTGGSLAEVCDWLNKNGHESVIIMRSGYDKYGHTSRIEGSVMVDTARDFYNTCIKYLKEWNPTHIHVSTIIRVLVLARHYQKRTPIVFEYHGGEIRSRKKPHPEVSLADIIAVSTEDLLKYGDIWLDRPIPSWFEYKGGRVPGTALMTYHPNYHQDQRELAKKWCEERGLKLTIVDRSVDAPILYDEMPAFLSKFEYFLEFKGFPDISLSKNAIEAIACGCKVVADAKPDEIIDDYRIVTPMDYYNLYKSMPKPKFTLRRALRLLISYPKWIVGRLGVKPLQEGEKYADGF
ncbi:MAG: hypothetical protein ACFFEK_07760 [Candidatus Thorarchaeota archaeon]